MYKTRGIENFWSLAFLDQFMFGHKGFIAGGCFKNILTDKKVKDIDIYFESNDDFKRAVNYFKKLVNERKYRPSYQNNKVEAFVCLSNGVRVELIKSIFGNPEEVINQFDFTVTKFAYYKIQNDDDVEYKIIHHNDFFEHLQMNRLVIDNLLLFPVSTFERSYKYRDYGFRLCKESRIKLLQAINEQEFIDENDFIASLYNGLD